MSIANEINRLQVAKDKLLAKVAEMGLSSDEVTDVSITASIGAFANNVATLDDAGSAQLETGTITSPSSTFAITFGYKDTDMRLQVAVYENSVTEGNRLLDVTRNLDHELPETNVIDVVTSSPTAKLIVICNGMAGSATADYASFVFKISARGTVSDYTSLANVMTSMPVFKTGQTVTSLQAGYYQNGVDYNPGGIDIDLSRANVVVSDIRNGKTAYGPNGLITGTLREYKNADLYFDDEGNFKIGKSTSTWYERLPLGIYDTLGLDFSYIEDQLKAL